MAKRPHPARIYQPIVYFGLEGDLSPATSHGTKTGTESRGCSSGGCHDSGHLSPLSDFNRADLNLGRGFQVWADRTLDWDPVYNGGGK